MAIKIIDNFKLGIAQPIDDRLTKQSIATALSEITTHLRYEGLTVYILDESKPYVFTGGIEDVHFVPLSAAGASGVVNPGDDGKVYGRKADEWVEVPTKTDFDSELSTVLTYKGDIADMNTLKSLPDKKTGDIYKVLEDGIEYTWINDEWVPNAGQVAQKNISEHEADKNNPHEVTAEQVGAYTKAETDALITKVFVYKGSVADEASLPSTNQNTGDVYNVLDTGDNYVWSGTEWDKLAGTVDLTYTSTGPTTNTQLGESFIGLEYTNKNIITLIDELLHPTIIRTNFKDLEPNIYLDIPRYTGTLDSPYLTKLTTSFPDSLEVYNGDGISEFTVEYESGTKELKLTPITDIHNDVNFTCFSYVNNKVCEEGSQTIYFADLVGFGVNPAINTAIPNTLSTNTTILKANETSAFAYFTTSGYYFLEVPRNHGIVIDIKDQNGFIITDDFTITEVDKTIAGNTVPYYLIRKNSYAVTPAKGFRIEVLMQSGKK